MHSKMRTANFAHDKCVKSNYETGECDKAACQVGRWGGGVESKREETKQKKLQTFQISAAGLVCMCIFFSLSQQDGRRGGGGGGGGDKSAYQNERLQQFPYYSYCNHFNPSPVCVPGCVDMAKRRDASYCMTN